MVAAKLSRHKESMACVFAVMAGVCWALRVLWYKLRDDWDIVMLFWISLVSTAQCRGREFLEGRNLSRCRSLLASSASIRVQLSFLICLGGRNKSKNHDKLLKHTVRVMCRLFILRFLTNPFPNIKPPKR